MTITEVKRLCPEVVLLDMDHESYELFSGRMNNIIERYTSDIERYSVDESFADITGLRLPLRKSYEEIALDLKSTLKRELGMTFSVGVAPTKVLAKIASNFKKPDGLTMIPGRYIEDFLEKFPIGHVWGIGRQTSAHMEKLGIVTALDFAQKPERWVTQTFSKLQQELWRELRGENVLPLKTGERGQYKSLMRTRTFTPPLSDRKFLLAELSRHVEVTCARAREHGLAGKSVSFFLKTQSFRYAGLHIKLSRATNIPEEILSFIEKRLDDIYDKRALYRAAGVTLFDLADNHASQMDLFDTTLRIEKLERIYEEVDELNTRFGKTLVHLASSTHLFHEKKLEARERDIEDFAKIGIPMIGDIS